MATMGHLTGYVAPFMKLSSRMSPRRPAPQLPLWTRQNPRAGGLLVSHGDSRRQDNSGAPLCLRVLASAANNSVSSVSVSAARPQYFPAVPTGGAAWHPSSTPYSSARAQHGRRLFSFNVSQFTEKPDDINHVSELSLGAALDKLKLAMGAKPKDTKEVVEALKILKKFADDENYCKNVSHAKDIVLTAVSSLRKHKLHIYGGVVKESLEVARLLLKKTTEEIRIQLCQCPYVQLKLNLSRIIQDNGGSAEVVKLAEEILEELP